MEKVCRVLKKVYVYTVQSMSGIPSHGKGGGLAGWIHFTTPLYKQDLLFSSVDRDRNWCVETSE